MWFGDDLTRTHFRACSVIHEIPRAILDHIQSSVHEEIVEYLVM